MGELDYQLLRRLQGELGRLRQDAVQERRMRGLPALAGDDGFQHGKALVQQVVTGYDSSRVEAGQPGLTWEIRQDLVIALEARLFGAGSLQQLLADDEVEDILINGYDHVSVRRADGTKVRLSPITGSNEELVETVQTLAAHAGLSARAFDVANVRVTLRLPDGSRLHAVQSVTKVPSIAIRKHRHMRVTLKDLVALDTLDEPTADFLRVLVAARKNVIIAGEVGAGKTTLLRALAKEIGPEERLFTVERSFELGLDEDVEAHPDCVAFEEREANAEGVGHEPLRTLVKDSLRMMPDRVIVGEVLGDEIVTMLNAMTQGNDGSLTTIHANSSLDVLSKIGTYAIQAPERLPWEATIQLVASALDFVVFIRRFRTEDGQVRKVASIREIRGMSEDRAQLMTNEIFEWDKNEGRLVQRVNPACVEDLELAGWRRGSGGWV